MTEDGETPQSNEAFPDASAVIDAFGGVRPMASRLGVAATTIQGWKSRGNIPEARRQEVRDVAAAAGIDLSGLPAGTEVAEETISDGTPEEMVADVPSDTPSELQAPTAKSGGQAIAWLALLAAIAVGVALYTQPQWSPVIYGQPEQADASDVLARLDALEAKPESPSLDPVTARLDALDAVLKSLPEPTESGPDLTPRIDELSEALDQRSARIDSLMAKLDALGQEVKGDLATVTETMRADVTALRSELRALDTRLKGLQDRNAAATGRTTGLALAVVSLERSVSGGESYTGVLAAVERLSGSDSAVMQEISVLRPDAATGISTVSELQQRFETVAATLGEPLWSKTGVSWADRVLERVDSMISVRRVEDDAGDALPARQAENAVAAGDLEKAVAALGDVEGPAADWVRDAKRRIAADKAVAALRLHAVEMLGKGLSDLGAPQ